MPTIFVKTPRIANKLLIDMHEMHEVYYLSEWDDVASTIDTIFKDENLRKFLYKQGPKSAIKLSGSSRNFDNLWTKCISKLVP